MESALAHVRHGRGSVRAYVQGPVELLEFVRRTFEAAELERHENSGGTIALEVEDLDGLIDELKAKGVTQERSHREPRLLHGRLPRLRRRPRSVTPAQVQLKAGHCTKGENIRPRTRMVRTWLSFGSGALLALSVSGAGSQSAEATTTDPPPLDRLAAALPLGRATGEDMLRRELAEALLSGTERMPERLSRHMNPFLPGGGLFGTMSDSVAFASTGGASSEHAAIHAVWSQVDAAWNARNAERFSRLFAENVSFRFVQRGQSLDGRTAIFQHFHERFPGYAPDLRHLTRISAVHPIAPGVVTADGKVEILRLGGGDDAAPTILRTFAIFAVMSSKDENWSIRTLRIYELPRGVDHPD